VEIVEVVYKSCLGLPGQLYHFILQEGNSFTKELRCELDPLNYLSSFQTNLAERGTPLKSSAFVEKSITVGETLGKSTRVVGESSDDLERVLWRSCGMSPVGRLA
jgi:hypothetical protein